MYLYHINFSFRLSCLILNDNGIESIELGNKVQGSFQFYTCLYLLHFLLLLFESDSKTSFVPINLPFNTTFNVINVIFCLDGQAGKFLFPVLQSLSLSRNKISQVRKCKLFFLFCFIIKLCSQLTQFLGNNIQWKLDIIKGQGTDKIIFFAVTRFGYKKKYPGSFSYILLFLG